MTHKILEKYYSTNLSPAEFGKLADSFVRSEISKELFDSRTEALKFYRDKYISSFGIALKKPAVLNPSLMSLKDR